MHTKQHYTYTFARFQAHGLHSCAGVGTIVWYAWAATVCESVHRLSPLRREMCMCVSVHSMWLRDVNVKFAYPQTLLICHLCVFFLNTLQLELLRTNYANSEIFMHAYGNDCEHESQKDERIHAH